MAYLNIDEKIYELHQNFHDGAFVDCEQCRSVIDIVDEATETARTSTIAGIQTEYSVERRPGRPAIQMPPPIDASPDEIAWAVLNTPPKKESEWKYLKKARGSDSA